MFLFGSLTVLDLQSCWICHCSLKIYLTLKYSVGVWDKDCQILVLHITEAILGTAAPCIFDLKRINSLKDFLPGMISIHMHVRFWYYVFFIPLQTVIVVIFNFTNCFTVVQDVLVSGLIFIILLNRDNVFYRWWSSAVFEQKNTLNDSHHLEIYHMVIIT